MISRFAPLLVGMLLLGGGGLAMVSAPVVPQAQAQSSVTQASDTPSNGTKSSGTKSVWKTFNPSGGRFSILMPGAPVPLGTAFVVEGQEMQLQQFVSSQQNDQVVYMAGWMDLPEGGLPSGELQSSLDSVRDGFRKRLNGKLLKEFKMTLSGHPGRHFKMSAQIDNRAYLITQRVYLRGDRLYQITTMVPERLEGSLRGSISGFLKSFKFL